MSRRVARYGFPKSLRLLGRAEFRRVYGEGQRRSNSLCTMFFRSNGLAHTRLGITTPRWIGSAIQRNRIRRRLREVFRHHQATIKPGWDVVLNPRPKVASTPFQNLEREMQRLFCRLPQAPPGEPPL
jgi:ribonuclease P protein component